MYYVYIYIATNIVEFFNLEGRELQTKDADFKWQSNCEKIVYFVFFLNCRKDILKKIAAPAISTRDMTYCYIGTTVDTTTKIAITNFSSLQFRPSTGCL